MLYDRWRAVATRHRRDRALVDIADNRVWSFGDLLDFGDRASRPDVPIACPAGGGAAFVLELLQAWRHGVPVCPLDPGQHAPPMHPLPSGWIHLKTTSATTGAARWVGFTAEQLVADPANLVATMGLRPEWPNVAVIPLAHSYGFSSLVLPLLLHGIPLILAPSALPEVIRRTVGAETAVTLPAVPSLWRSWFEANAVPRSVRLAISAGAPLPPRLERALHDSWGLKLHNFYGASECGGIAYDATFQPREDPAVVGTAVWGVRLALNDDGCLVVQGPQVGSGYWPEAQDALQPGAFHSRDLAELQDGTVRLLGRADDLLNLAGRKVLPEEIERAILVHPSVRQCLVFGVPRRDEEHGDLIVAVVEMQPGADRRDLEEDVRARLPAWQVPRDWWYVDALPPNARGKLQRRAWREKYLQLHR